MAKRQASWRQQTKHDGEPTNNLGPKHRVKIGLRRLQSAEPETDAKKPKAKGR